MSKQATPPVASVTPESSNNASGPTPLWSRTLRRRMALAFSSYTSALIALTLAGGLAYGALAQPEATQDIANNLLIDQLSFQAVQYKRTTATSLIGVPDGLNPFYQSGPMSLIGTAHWDTLALDGYTPYEPVAAPVPTFVEAWPAQSTWDAQIADALLRGDLDEAAKTLLADTRNGAVTTLATRDTIGLARMQSKDGTFQRWVRRTPSGDAFPVIVRYVTPREFEARSLLTNSAGKPVAYLRMRASASSVWPGLIIGAGLLWLLLSLPVFCSRSPLAHGLRVRSQSASRTSHRQPTPGRAAR
jgi:hypothetical protein